ncbi:hypothetical protein CC86DRAFT_285140 [Ophiobolus disseminans]|uniref:Zn(2)-C6 fungal-type domain-containing protein n=1 Tax=Ophiobolus disseminans TaxID=1469910 RepID=A0A6A7AB16_9PLEO|nr:hypothetical protein CC86DRAFT_285140 [Ophiobolus disseminans]
MTSTPQTRRTVAIPRMARSDQRPHAAQVRRRVSRACTACRSHKIKCTGDKPLCAHCAETERECVYIMPRKDRLKVVTEQCREMAGLLGALRNFASAEDKVRIANIVDEVTKEISDIPPPTASTDPDGDSYLSPESRWSGSLDQDQKLGVETLDVLDENLHGEQLRATGFVGRSSEVHWLRVALSQTEESEVGSEGILPQRTGSYVSDNDQIHTYSYWTDGQLPDLGFPPETRGLPQPEVAERLVHCYMSKIHDSFPIFPCKIFEDKFLRYLAAERQQTSLPSSKRWEAILYLVFAIAARMSHLTKASWRGAEYDHLVYQARAKHLGLSEVSVFNPPDLQQIQGLGLLAFYWMSVGQVSRAWTSIGLAVRFAYSLGLHVQNEDPSATAVAKENLARTWWSLHWLESTLSTMTGRPSTIVDSRCSVSFPLTCPEGQASEGMAHASCADQRTDSPVSISSNMAFGSRRNSAGFVRRESNPGSYFRTVAELSVITQSILSELYSAGTISQTFEDIQRSISQIGRRLEQWLKTLPIGFNLQQIPRGVSEPWVQERILLSFRFCSARILLTRPCLVGRGQQGRYLSEGSFMVRSADACVEAAKTMVGFLPDEPQSDLIRTYGPWWNIVHHITQAISVLLLTLSCPSISSHDNLTSLQCTKKAIRWLHNVQDPLAGLASQRALDALEVIGRRYNFDCSDLWSLGAENLMHRQNSVPDVFMPAHPSHVMATMQAAEHAGTFMTSFAAFDPGMTGTAFSPHDGSHPFENSFYMAGS